MTTNWSTEPFVDAAKAAEFLKIARRRVLEMARRGEIPGHPVGNGARKLWRFRLSELADEIAGKKVRPPNSEPNIIGERSPRQPNRRN